MGQELVPGVYELLRDGKLRRALQALDRLESDERELVAAEAPERLAKHLADRLVGALPRRDLDQQIELTGKLLALLELEEETPPRWTGRTGADADARPSSACRARSPRRSRSSRCRTRTCW